MDKHVTAFLGGCNWQAGPPKHWKRELDRALWATALARQVELPTAVRNRPVPRAANHHYDGVKSLSLTGGPTTFYFY